MLDRRVEDRLLELSADERALYDAVEDYIASTYNQASVAERTAVGFVMTIYRRRLASSFSALRQTLQRHLDAMTTGRPGPLAGLAEDAPDDDTTDDILEADDVGTREREALAAEEKVDIERLLAGIGRLPPDSKLGSLKRVLHELRGTGYGQVMVFTQYTDTMDFLRDALLQDAEARLMCFSGRGGEIPSADGSWRRIGRDDAKRRFRDREADVLLCTDAAAEGLNFQFCGAWSITTCRGTPCGWSSASGGSIGLANSTRPSGFVNLHYQDTVESDVVPGAEDPHRPVRVRGRPLAADSGAHATDDFASCALWTQSGCPGTCQCRGRDRTGDAGTRRARVRYRYDDRERHRHTDTRAVVCHHGGSRQNDRET